MWYPQKAEGDNDLLQREALPSKLGVKAKGDKDLLCKALSVKLCGTLVSLPVMYVVFSSAFHRSGNAGKVLNGITIYFLLWLWPSWAIKRSGWPTQ